MSLIVGVPISTYAHILAPALDSMSVPDDYKFLNLFFPVVSDMKIRAKL
jgi:hypothetical protein